FLEDEVRRERGASADLVRDATWGGEPEGPSRVQGLVGGSGRRGAVRSVRFRRIDRGPRQRGDHGTRGGERAERGLSHDPRLCRRRDLRQRLGVDHGLSFLFTWVYAPDGTYLF